MNLLRQGLRKLSYYRHTERQTDRQTKTDRCHQNYDQGASRVVKILFKTSSTDTVKHCQEYFGLDLISVLWAKRMQKFEVKFGLYLSSE